MYEEITKFKFEKHQIKSFIFNVKMWCNEFKKHTKLYPNEVAYKERILNILFSEYKKHFECEPYLTRPILKEQYGESFYKYKLLAEKYLKI